ncbi:ceramide synthase 3-like [Hyalella azteca]|uniref:Ceramide synthase 3-like n=1 Tax=Hyalella azteca TaxID=294128 RepID=A0A8B7MZD6_HYAAZ|nr:ceramide synthase 3-like [Hyalella azteca]
MDRTWSEWMWLPRRLRWIDIPLEDPLCFPDLFEFFMWASIFGVVYYSFKKIVFFPYISTPIAMRAGVEAKVKPHPPDNTELEALYSVSKNKPTAEMLAAAVISLGWPERKVQRWLRQKYASQQKSNIDKFNESAFMLFFYTSFTIAGALIIIPKPFFGSPETFLREHPFVSATSDVWWYWVANCGYYLSHTYSYFTQPKVNEFYRTLCHHSMVFLLYVFSLSLNLVAPLCHGLITHEVSDIPLLLGKLFLYTKNTKCSDACVFVFAVLWVVSRLILYPVLGIWPVFQIPYLIDSEYWPGLVLCLVYTIVLLVLHLIWTYELASAIRKKFQTKTHVVDYRSSEDEPFDNDEEIVHKQTHFSSFSNFENTHRRTAVEGRSIS